MAKRNQTDSEFMFFCLFWLRMSPGQVAEMMPKEGGWTTHTWEVFIRDWWNYTVAYAAADGHFLH